MSLPYHDVHTRKQQDDIEEPYADAREQVTQTETVVRNQAQGRHEAELPETEDDRRDRLEREASDLLGAVQDDVKSSDG